MDELTCSQLVELVTEYLEGALGPVWCSRFEEHLLTCRSCEVHIDQMRRTLDLLGRISQEESLPAGAECDLLVAFRGGRSA
jgi:hypothetical protein